MTADAPKTATARAAHPGERAEERTSLPVVGHHRSRAVEPEHRIKPPVDPATLVHKQLLGGDFWRRIPAYRDVDEATFLDYRWQMKRSVTKVAQLLSTVQELADDQFINDVRE